ncbi:MAG: hypothetical protein COT74_05095 [Bdellovibrionales bacterium CG10_big_fil_rev_8_21_14_0_10_45_34]|nr:MAG: hypothetical protein COT74_05095 [Bdellovibrionales bacterium CG10_big_fil_rev_8_21_14_0_10_45_34]
MRRQSVVLLFSLGFAFAAKAASDAGPSNFHRVVSLSPAITEILTHLGITDKLVGITEQCDDYDPSLAKIESVGDYFKPNFEKVAMLKPDILLVPDEGVGYSEREPKRIGLRYEVMRLKALSDYPFVVEKLGELFKRKDVAQKMSRQWRSQWEALDKKNQGNVLIQLQLSPPIFAGGGTFLSEAFARCGFTNILSKQVGYPQVSREALAKFDEEFLVVPLIHEKTRSVSDFWKFQSRAILLDERLFEKQSPPVNIVRLGPSFLIAAKAVCEALARQLHSKKSSNEME